MFLTPFLIYFKKENAAICDQVAEIQENIVKVKEERKFLLKKLIDFEPELLTEELKASNQLPNNNTNVSTPTTRRPYKKRAKKWTNDATAADSPLNGEQKPKIELLDSNGPLIIQSLGQIVYDRPHFHSESNIYPIGFQTTRIYSNVKDPERKCIYTCRIIDGGDKPVFQIISENESELFVTGPAPDLVHLALLQLISKNSNIPNIDSCPDGNYFFGLSHPSVVASFRSMPELNKCINFKGFSSDANGLDNESNPAINFDALQKLITMSAYHTVLEVKEEPPDELLELSSSDSRLFNEIS